ncbi:type II secretion system F family protein [Paenisporosarcina cavernae]|uniref:Type II secretion system protein GspF domain-containing protein n=1 Tax=Paenisporosarcina cavernae TaxID=2320858 RepID=A0A385YSR1_9BACL|nr:type II secretion system F family protein [Paenisporosarcina cavernae]AYC29564.1 hypothetical protein D3873_06585 [Paenisporosarcina cavernae]
MAVFTRRINRNPLIPVNDQHIFLRKTVELLQEGYTIQHAILLLIPLYSTNYTKVETFPLNVSEPIYDLFGSLGIPQKMLFPLLTVSTSEDLITSLVHTANYIQMEREAKTKLQQIMVYPMVLFGMLAGLMVIFRLYLYPNMERLYQSRVHSGAEKENLTVAFMNSIPSLLSILLLLLIVIVGSWFLLYRKNTLRKKMQKLRKIPWFGDFLVSYWTRSYALVLGTLLISNTSSKHAFDTICTFYQHPVLLIITTDMLDLLMVGDSLSQAVLKNEFLRKDLYDIIYYGEMHGHVGKELVLYSNHLTEKMGNQLERLIKKIQPIVFILVALAIILSYLSILLPMYQLIELV